MDGMVFGSVGTPFSPWHAAHSCTFAAMSSAADAGVAVTAKLNPAPKIAENEPLSMAAFLPTRDYARFQPSIQTKRPGRNPVRPSPVRPSSACRADQPTQNSASKPADQACPAAPAESRYSIRRLSIRVSHDPEEVGLQSK